MESAPGLGSEGERSGAAGRPLTEPETEVCCVYPKRDKAKTSRMKANLEGETRSQEPSREYRAGRRDLTMMSLQGKRSALPTTT